MSSNQPPKGGKPFLADNDLQSELDAWDDMFDALHETQPADNATQSGPEPAPAHALEPTPGPVPVVAPAATAWPAAPDPTVVSQVPTALLASAAEPFDPASDLEEQMTLDRALEDSPTLDAYVGGADQPFAARSSAFAETMDSDPRETDFSDVGAEGAPAALGEMLGAAPASSRSAAPTLPPQMATPRDFLDEDEVFTSASRPSLPTAAAQETPVAAPPVARRAPAIVRRAPVIEADPETTPARGVDLSDFGDATKVQTYDEMEAQRAASRDRSDRKTQPPPMAFADDEYEIEVDASPGTAEPAVEPAAEAASNRRTAHVVRRTDTATRPPPLAGVAATSAPAAAGPLSAAFSHLIPEPVGPSNDDDEVSLEFSAEEPSRTSAAVLSTEQPPAALEALSPGASLESDFADVAAAVGAEADPMADSRPATPASDVVAAPPALLGEEDVDRTPLPQPRALGDDVIAFSPTTEPPPAEHAAEAAALADLYPRVKTPTSVPPMADPLREVFDFAGDEATTARPRRIQTMLPVEPSAEPETKHDLQVAVRSWPEIVTPLMPQALDESSASTLLAYERELATVDDSAASAALRLEAGRLSERLGDIDRARGHYDAALLADPRATAALRGLRRIARASGDLVEAVRQLDAEIAVAGALERRPLAHYRVDLLLASNEQDLARVAVGELLDSAASDVRALLAQLELAFLDGRADEFGTALEQLAVAMTDAELRAAVQSARGALAAHQNDIEGASKWFTAAAESDPSSISARIGAVRHAVSQSDSAGASAALLALAQQLEASDPLTAASAAVRAEQWSPSPAAAALAISAATHDPLVARLSAETIAASDDLAAKAQAFGHWSMFASSAAERSFAAARAAELDASRAATLWAYALENDPGDDYGAAQLRTAHVVAEATQASIEVDLAVADDPERERARLRAAYGLIAQGKLDEAISLLVQGRAARPSSPVLGEALAEALAAANRWTDRAKLLAEIAAEPGEQLDRDVAQLRSALAWEEAVGAAAASDPPSEDLARATVAALEAWDQVLARSPDSPSAHAASILLASRVGEREVMAEVLARVQDAERSPWSAASLGLRRARLFAGEDVERAETLLRELAPNLDDPRRTAALVIGAARRKELGDAATALDERASLLDEATSAHEIAALRLRAAQLALDAGDAPRATSLLVRVEQTLPELGVIGDLLSAARRRAGDRPSVATRRTDVAPGASTADAFARIVRDADLATAHGDGPAALALYQRALELRPLDPLAALPLVRLATQLGDPAPISALALAQLRAAEEAQDGVAKATAYELLALIDGELRSDPESAQVALESAAQADPSRIDLLHRLERRYAAADQVGELLRLRRAELDAMTRSGIDVRRDRGALLVDVAGLMARDGSPELELADQYRAALDASPASRLALMHLETIVRRGGFSAELAQLEEKIATYFTGDPRTQAAFWTRAGETLAELGQITEAVKRFGNAEAALPGHVPALEGWRLAAIKGELWAEVADAATRQAAVTADAKAKADLYHVAGVALMDKALEGENAMVAFRRALEANPAHRDSFLRMRILLEEDANHDDLATLLANRLEVEDDARARVGLHRALAELHRNFLSDRDTAKEHYRFILAADPNDLRAHAAVADIAWEQGNWQEAADALVARARLEREPEILKTLCFRLGLIYADRLVDIPMALKAFQRALTYQPDDENTLVRLADLATQASEWKLALGACERLVKNEADPEKRVGYLHRVAKIFRAGFNDNKRAERALNLALDAAPASDEALTALVQFYRDCNDLTSARVHLNRVAGTMRTRASMQPSDGTAYRVISRAMTARHNAGVDGSLRIARAAAELTQLLKVAEEPEQKLLHDVSVPEAAPLARPEADEVLFPRGVQLELRQIFQLLGDRIAKHVGVDLRPYGLARGDRLRAKENATAGVAQNVASSLGFGEIDVYVSQRQPWAMVAEPTSPVSLIIGSSIVAAGNDAIRFASGAALKLAQTQLAIPARMSPDELGVLVTALLRLFQPEFPIHLVDADAVAAQVQKLRRLIPTGVLTELRPYAFAIDPQSFDHRVLARDLKVAGLRAGLVASGSLVTGLQILASQAGGELPAFLADPVAQGLISFALGEDHALVAR
ncbi:MAG: hypothetical protein SFX73_00180 [Kofleriaceae bacterium]|nr:hypothetical protein [Kofleriaceae bacterium]